MRVRVNDETANRIAPHLGVSVGGAIGLASANENAILIFGDSQSDYIPMLGATARDPRCHVYCLLIDYVIRALIT